MRIPDFFGNAQFTSNQSEINVEGDFQIKNLKAEKKRLIPNGFHVTASISESSINDSIQKLLKQFIPGIESNLTSISMNYRGTYLTKDDDILFLPDGDFLLGFDQKQDFRKLLIEQDSLENIELKGPSTFLCGGKQFVYKQIDEKHIYFGTNPMKTTNNNGHLLFISGSPSIITKLKGNTMMQRLIKMFPSYRASNDFFKAMDNIEIALHHDKNGEKLKGKIDFKEGNSPFPTILKFLIKTRLID